ncbi:hypothetical protein [Segatella hominis]|uniref:hypothetical protein n=1 Tax=Segatella hominis TaxID=2518605 RepID=UPI003AB59F6B
MGLDKHIFTIYTCSSESEVIGLARRAETSERDKLRMISTRLTESQIASMESSAKALGISKVDVIRMGIEWVASYVENIKA